MRRNTLDLSLPNKPPLKRRSKSVRRRERASFEPGSSRSRKVLVMKTNGMLPPRYIYLPPGVRAQGGDIDDWVEIAEEMREAAEEKTEKVEGGEVDVGEDGEGLKVDEVEDGEIVKRQEQGTSGRAVKVGGDDVVSRHAGVGAENRARFGKKSNKKVKRTRAWERRVKSDMQERKALRARTAASKNRVPVQQLDASMWAAIDSIVAQGGGTHGDFITKTDRSRPGTKTSKGEDTRTG
jgi:hypothetical protein